MLLSPLDVGNRLFKIRFVLQKGPGPQGKFAKKYFKVEDGGTYSKWETGAQMLPVVQAVKILDHLPGLTLDWIYLGGFERLGRASAVEALRAAPDRVDKPTPAKPPPSDEEAGDLLKPLRPRKARKRST